MDPKISCAIDTYEIKKCDYSQFFSEHPQRAKLIFAKDSGKDPIYEYAKKEELIVIENC